MRREYYSDRISTFREKSSDEILGELVRGRRKQAISIRHSAFSQNKARSGKSTELPSQIQEKQNIRDPSPRQQWRPSTALMRGQGLLEYSIPCLGRRIDVVRLIGPVIFVLEFKVYEEVFKTYAVDQVWDYALDLKNFHESSHEPYVAPILIATAAKQPFEKGSFQFSAFRFQPNRKKAAAP